MYIGYQLTLQDSSPGWKGKLKVSWLDYILNVKYI